MHSLAQQIPLTLRLLRRTMRFSFFAAAFREQAEPALASPPEKFVP